MPPEQASGKRGKVGRHSDVYGLGGILYYTLTARAPFQGATLETTIHEVLNSEPLSPRVLSPSVPRDLETICLKCLEKEASRRYQTAQELAEELGRFLNDEPIHARPVSRTQCAWRWCRRKPALAGSLAAVAVLLLLVAIGAPIAAFRISHERNTAERNLYVAEMNLAAQAWEAGNIPRARELLGQHWPGTAGLLSRVAQSSTDVPSFEWRLLWGLAHEDHSKFSFSTGTNRISCVAVSPNGEYLGWGSADGVVRIIDLVRQHEVTTLSGHADGVSSLAFSADGRSLASGGGDGTIRLWESGSWREVRGFTGHSNAVRYVAFHPNGTKLISSGDDALRVWELGAGEGVEVIRRPDEGNTISADGTLLASYGGLNNRVRFWKLGRKEPLPSLPPQKGVILATAFFPDGKSALISAHDSSVTRWDLASMKPTQTYRQKSMVGKLALSANGQILATASYDNVIKLWDVASGQELRTLRGHTNAVATLVLSADGRTLVSASEGNIKIWDSSAEREMNALHHQGLLLNMSLSRNGKLLATSDPNFHTVSVWDVPSQRLRYSFTDPEHKGRATVALSPNSRWLAVQWFFNRKLELWDLSEEPFQKGPTHAVEFALGIHLNFSPDGRVLSFRGTNGMVKLWNVAEQKIFGALANHGDGCATAFSMDSKIIATSSDREIRLWDVQSQRPLGVFNAPRASVWSLSFSPDGRLLAAGSHGDNAVRVWDVADPTNSRLLTPLVGHTAGARAVAFSPDGRTLASGSLDSTVKLWSVALWQEVATLREHSSEVGCLAFSSDGNMLFTGSGDATVRIWRAPTFQEIENKETKRGRQP
jgi:WD40 repeat protein